MLEFDREYMIIKRMDIACWLDNARNTHSEQLENSPFHTNKYKQHHNCVISVSTLTVLFFLFVFAKCNLINTQHQNSTRNVQKPILLTKYISIQPIHISNNVQHATSKVNMKRSAIPCIPVYSPMAYDNLFLRYRTLCIAQQTLVPNVYIGVKSNTGKYTGECKYCKICREGLNIRNFHQSQFSQLQIKKIKSLQSPIICLQRLFMWHFVAVSLI